MRGDQPILGVVYHPLLRELFVAEQGTEATMNGRRIRVGKIAILKNTIVAMNKTPGTMETTRYSRELTTLLPKIRTNRCLGATALDLCYVAAGRLDGFTCIGCRLYDCAAGNYIAKKAGARVTDFSGRSFKWTNEVSDIIVANVSLNHQLVSLLRKV